MPETTRPKPLPIVTEESRPFWDGCREGKLRLQYCEQCKQYQFYPRLYCMQCGAETPSWVEVSGRGDLPAYSLALRAASPLGSAASLRPPSTVRDRK